MNQAMTAMSTPHEGLGSKEVWEKQLCESRDLHHSAVQIV